MNQAEFHRMYEDESDRIFKTLSSFTEDELLRIIADKEEDRFKIWEGNDNFQIWQAFKANGTIKSIRPLFDVVCNLSIKYLVRYHACNALFALAGIHDDNLKGEVQYGRNANREKVDQKAAIRQLAELLNVKDSMD